MSHIQYKDSAYRFTDPVRLFKENDPYYFEVDNIPLKQLQENCNWLKDQLSALAGGNFEGVVRRKNFEELRPYVDGGDRTVRVRPGRYTSRINDAYNRNPLAILEQIGNLSNSQQGFFGGDEWSSQAPGINELGSTLFTALEKFKSTLAEDALGCDGLIGRTFTWPTISETDPADGDGAQAAVQAGTLGYNSLKLNRLLFPLTQIRQFDYRDDPGAFTFAYGGWYDDFYGYTQGVDAEQILLKKWRGIARNAIVAVDEELSIDIPPFDVNDFNYINSDGQEIQVDGVQSRIDLVFIYSKPVDRDKATILKGTGLETITKPVLGVVKGAGIKLDQRSLESTGELESGPRKVAATDEHKMFASPGDQFNDNLGFTATSSNDVPYTIKGSFPAPDDILNLAPLISDKLESTAYELVGQTILPIAYVWVHGTSEVTSPALEDGDIIDIRPFFRTAELTYNERTGIAAAVPQLSISNPAVGKGQLDRTAQNLKNYVDAQLSTSTATDQKVLATGYVFGGMSFGPEGALANYYSREDNSLTTAELRDIIATKYGYGNANNPITIPILPQWDQNSVIRSGNIATYNQNQSGFTPLLNRFLKTYVNIFNSGDRNDNTITPDIDDSIVAGTRAGYSLDFVEAAGLGLQGGSYGGLPIYSDSVEKNFLNSNPLERCAVHFNYVRKKIKFSRPSNLLDYHVDVSLVNCIPMSFPGSIRNGAYTGIFVEKGYDYFTIYIAYATEKLTDLGERALQEHLIDEGHYSGFITLTEDIELSNPAALNLGLEGYNGNPRVGKCALPTVTWSLTGIANNGGQHFYPNLNGFEPTISLDNFA